MSRRLMPGDLFEVQYTDPPKSKLIPQAIDLDILFEDSNVLVINKPQGMVVHPGSGNPEGTLVNAVLYYCRQIGEEFSGEMIRPGIVHRLDKDTSGIIIIAKNPESLEFLADQFRKGSVRKQYLAIVKGRPLAARKGRIETLISRDPHNRKRFAVPASSGSSGCSGKRAVTYYHVLKEFDGFSLISLRPKTGRTHQLRVHMAYKGCPILGDPIYSRKSDHPFMLHAYKLSILLPGEKDLRLFRAPVPMRFRTFIRLIKAHL